jgi:D-glycero-alpha-D-manno-heptose 1-phosphate guanylyltransferase
MAQRDKNRGKTRGAETAPTEIRDMQAVILCGGAGTRLKDVLPGVPKALAPVAGRPFLDHILRSLAGAGIADVVLCVGVHGDAIREYCRLNAAPGIALVCSQERKPLGTGGALKHAEKLIRSHSFFLLNGDTLLDFDLPSLIAQHRATRAAITMVLTSISTVQTDAEQRYGNVEVAADNRITRFREKAIMAKRTSLNGHKADALGNAGYVNAGSYLMQKDILRKLPSAPPAVSLEKEILPKYIGKGLYGYRAHGFFIDIGVPEDLRRAQTELSGRLGFAATNTR